MELTPEEQALLDQWWTLSVANQEKYEALQDVSALQKKFSHYMDTERLGADITVPDIDGVTTKSLSERDMTTHFQRIPFHRRCGQSNRCAGYCTLHWNSIQCAIEWGLYNLGGTIE